MSQRFSQFFNSRLFVIGLFLFISLGFILYQRTHKLRVFVLHSYHSSMPWVHGLETGLEHVFKKRQYIEMRSFYMNTKRKNSPAYLRRITKEAIALIKRYKPDVLIVFDIDAQKLVAKRLANKLNCKIVLAGITDSDDLIDFKLASNVTGVLEKIPVKVVTEVLSLMVKKERRLYYLSDNSLAANQLDKDIIKERWAPFTLVAHNKAQTFSLWKQYVLEAQTKADVILLSTYHMVKEEGKKMSSLKLIQWTLAHSKIPVVGLYESFVNDGGYLAIAVASYEQGYTAGKIALFLLEKKLQIDRVPFVQSQMFQLLLRKRLILKHYPSITIPMILEAFSKTKWQLDDLLIKKLRNK